MWLNVLSCLNMVHLDAQDNRIFLCQISSTLVWFCQPPVHPIVISALPPFKPGLLGFMLAEHSLYTPVWPPLPKTRITDMNRHVQLCSSLLMTVYFCPCILSIIHSTILDFNFLFLFFLIVLLFTGWNSYPIRFGTSILLLNITLNFLP